MKRYLPCFLAVCLVAAVSSSRGAEALLVADTYTASANPASNFGAQASLNVGLGQVAMWGFDLSMLPAGANASNIVQVQLIVYVNRIGLAGLVDLRRVSSGWAESTVTHNTAPVLANSTGRTRNITAPGQFIAFDITQDVRDWLNGAPNHGLAITQAVGSSAAVFFDGKESTATGHPARAVFAFSALPQTGGGQLVAWTQADVDAVRSASVATAAAASATLSVVQAQAGSASASESSLSSMNGVQRVGSWLAASFAGFLLGVRVA